MPQSSDYSPVGLGIEKVQMGCSLLPKNKLLNDQIFEKFDLETLFFIFYFQKVNYAFLILNLEHVRAIPCILGT